MATKPDIETRTVLTPDESQALIEYLEHGAPPAGHTAYLAESDATAAAVHWSVNELFRNAS